jgi:hypothetical protein
MENATALVLQLHKEGKITTEEAMTLLDGMQPKVPDTGLQPNVPVNPITTPYVPAYPQSPWTVGDPPYPYPNTPGVTPTIPHEPWITYTTDNTADLLKSNQPDQQ